MSRCPILILALVLATRSFGADIARRLDAPVPLALPSQVTAAPQTLPALSVDAAPVAPTLLSQSAQLRNVLPGGRDASPGRTAAALESFFEQGAGSPEDPSPSAPPALIEKAAPWRTQTQLARLAAEPRQAHEPFQFSVIGDAEPGRFWIWRALFNKPGVFAKLLRRVERTSADFTIQLGDMVSRGSARNYNKFFDLLNRIAPLKPYLTIIGNHDRRRPHGVTDSKLYEALLGPTNYYFDRGGVRFVMLDSSAKRLTAEQLKWFDAALDTPLRKIVMTHMPPTLLKQWTGLPGLPAAGGFRQGAEAFSEIVSRRGVERVYVGHVHGFGAVTHAGVRYVLTGGGGSPLFPAKRKVEKFHHFLTVDVLPDGGLIETVHKANGQSFQIPSDVGVHFQ